MFTPRTAETSHLEDRLEQCENALEDVMSELWAMIVNEDIFRSRDISREAFEAERDRAYVSLTRIVTSTWTETPKRYIM